MSKSFRIHSLAAIASITASSVLFLSGCGTEPRTVVAQGREVSIQMTDYRFLPQNLRVQARHGKIRFDLENRGQVGHNFVVMDGDIESFKVETMKPGDRRTVEAKLKPGEYEITCSVGNHDKLGMHGTLTIVDRKA